MDSLGIATPLLLPLEILAATGAGVPPPVPPQPAVARPHPGSGHLTQVSCIKHTSRPCGGSSPTKVCRGNLAAQGAEDGLGGTQGNREAKVGSAGRSPGAQALPPSALPPTHTSPGSAGSSLRKSTNHFFVSSSQTVEGVGGAQRWGGPVPGVENGVTLQRGGVSPGL